MADEEQKEIDPLRVTFGLRLKAAREAKSFTQQEVADRFGVKKGTVSAWETGRGAPDAFTLRALAKLYAVSADALLSADAPSAGAMKIAAEYDHLPEQRRRDWAVLWLGFTKGVNAPEEPAQPPPMEDREQAKRDAEIAERVFASRPGRAGKPVRNKKHR